MTGMRSLAAALAAGALALSPAAALAAGTTATPAGGTAAPGTAATTTAPAATTPAAPSTTTPAGPATTTLSPAAAGTPQTATAPPTTTTAKAPAKGGGGVSGWAILAAAIGALVVLACLVWAVFRFGAYEPHWLASARHSAAEAGYRASATWAEFTDWARLGH